MMFCSKASEKSGETRLCPTVQWNKGQGNKEKRYSLGQGLKGFQELELRARLPPQHPRQPLEQPAHRPILMARYLVTILF